MKTVTFTWRVSAEVKSALEKEARHEKVTVAALLDQVTRQWLQDRRAKSAGDLAGQSKLHAEAAKSIGKIAGENPSSRSRSEFSFGRVWLESMIADCLIDTGAILALLTWIASPDSLAASCGG